MPFTAHNLTITLSTLPQKMIIKSTMGSTPTHKSFTHCHPNGQKMSPQKEWWIWMGLSISQRWSSNKANAKPSLHRKQHHPLIFPSSLLSFSTLVNCHHFLFLKGSSKLFNSKLKYYLSPCTIIIVYPYIWVGSPLNVIFRVYTISFSSRCFWYSTQNLTYIHSVST